MDADRYRHCNGHCRRVLASEDGSMCHDIIANTNIITSASRDDSDANLLIQTVGAVVVAIIS
jgi:hypothetical protein